MNRTAIYALLVAFFLPLICYFIMKSVGRSAIDMPRHYHPDTVITRTERGKQTTDTVWHKLPDFNLTNQLGQQVSWKDMDSQVVVANFFFTHCPTICPRMTMNMKRLQDAIRNQQKVGDRQPDFIRFLSFSIDPERDSVEALKKWADRFQVNPATWWLLTGDKKTIYDFSINHIKLGLVDGEGIDTGFIHSDRFVLIDKHRQVRGYYHGLDTTDLARLAEHIIFLNLEKEPGRKSVLSDKLPVIAGAMLLTLLGLGIFLIILRKTRPKSAKTG